MGVVLDPGFTSAGMAGMGVALGLKHPGPVGGAAVGFLAGAMVDVGAVTVSPGFDSRRRSNKTFASYKSE